MADNLVRVLPDANVCYPISLLDLILRCDEQDLHRVVWTDDLLDELVGVWVRNGARTTASARSISDQIRAAFPDDHFSGLLDSAPEEVLGVLRAMAGHRRRPPTTLEEILSSSWPDRLDPIRRGSRQGPRRSCQRRRALTRLHGRGGPAARYRSPARVETVEQARPTERGTMLAHHSGPILNATGVASGLGVIRPTSAATSTCSATIASLFQARWSERVLDGLEAVGLVDSVALPRPAIS